MELDTNMDTNALYILKQLNDLEDAFYDGIDQKLLNQHDLSIFAIQMNKIINSIKKTITGQNITGQNMTSQPGKTVKPMNTANMTDININYAQLEQLRYKYENSNK